MLVLIVVLAVLLVAALGAVSVPLDRWCASVAERRVAAALTRYFAGEGSAGDGPAAPVVFDVRAGAGSFFAQAVRGHYPALRVRGAGLRMGELTGVAVVAEAEGLRWPLRAALGRSPVPLACTRLRGTLVFPYGELARIARVQGLQLTRRGERLLASAAVPIPGFSQLARVNGEALWTVGDGGSVWLRVRGLSVAGIAVPSVVLNQILPTLDIPVPMPALPHGLRIDRVQPTADGLAVTGGADAITWSIHAAATNRIGSRTADQARSAPAPGVQESPSRAR